MQTKTPKELLAKLREKTGVQPNALYRKLAKIRKDHGGLISVPQSAALLAGQLGIKLERYFDADFISRLPHGPSGGLEVATQGRSRGPSTKREGSRAQREVTLRLPGILGESFPHLDPGTAADAKRMAEVYPAFYLFENSARGLLMAEMSRVYTENWWETDHVSAGTKKLVKDRQAKEEKHRWHESRAAHPLYYTDMDDLRHLIEKNWDEVFEPLLGDRVRVQAMFTEMEELRNIVAHNNPLSPGDVDRLKSNVKVWIKQLKNPRRAIATEPHHSPPPAVQGPAAPLRADG